MGGIAQCGGCGSEEETESAAKSMEPVTRFTCERRLDRRFFCAFFAAVPGRLH